MTPKDTIDVLRGYKQGSFEGYYFEAQYGFGDEDLPDRWEVINVDPRINNDVEWEFRLYKYLNSRLFPISG